MCERSSSSLGGKGQGNGLRSDDPGSAWNPRGSENRLDRVFWAWEKCGGRIRDGSKIPAFPSTYGDLAYVYVPYVAMLCFASPFVPDFPGTVICHQIRAREGWAD